MSNLPACPLCNREPHRDKGNRALIKCPNTLRAFGKSFHSDSRSRACPLSFRWMTESEWRRLARPSLPPDLVSVCQE